MNGLHLDFRKKQYRSPRIVLLADVLLERFPMPFIPTVLAGEPKWAGYRVLQFPAAPLKSTIANGGRCERRLFL